MIVSRAAALATGVYAALVLLGCGAGPEARREDHAHPSATLALPEVGTRYEAAHRVRVRFDGVEEGTLRARMLLEVTARREREIDLRIEASLLEEDRSVAGFDELEVTMDASGQLVGPVRSRCADPDFDELVSTRLVMGTLGSRPVRTDGEASSLPGVVTSELDETRAAVTFRRSAREAVDGVASEGSVMRASTSIALRSATLLGTTYRGAVQAEVTHALSATDPLVGRSRTTLEGEVEARSSEGTRRGLLEVTSDTEIALSDGTAHTAPRHCERGFSSALLVRAVGERVEAITDCYEQALALDPTLRGRLQIQVTVSEAGETEDVRVAESSVAPGTSEAWDAAGQCVIAILDGLAFGEGPVGGATFAFPFAFDPHE